jgi:signal peptidase I
MSHVLKNLNWKSRAFWRDGWGSIGLAIFLALTIRWGLFEAYVIPSGSMLPSLLIRDHIFVNKLVYGLRVPFSEKWLVRFNEPQRGEIIVFKYPEDMSTFFIKRIVGMPGDKIEIKDATLFINDQIMEKSAPTSTWDYDWLRDKDFGSDSYGYSSKDQFVHFTEDLSGTKHSILLRKTYGSKDFGPHIVPKGGFFVMGDNRDSSLDSRYWGIVPFENILGRASMVWLSCEETIPVFSFLCNPLTLRWGRFFYSIK